MPNTCKASEIEIGYHPQGYRIDKTTSPLNRYTRWTVSTDGILWTDPKPVCFDSMPLEGWLKVKKFEWTMNTKKEEPLDKRLKERIEKRAYELFVKRGGRHGYALEDWLKAERETMQDVARKASGSAQSKPVLRKSKKRTAR